MIRKPITLYMKVHNDLLSLCLYFLIGVLERKEYIKYFENYLNLYKTLESKDARRIEQKVIRNAVNLKLHYELD